MTRKNIMGVDRRVLFAIALISLQLIGPCSGAFLVPLLERASDPEPEGVTVVATNKTIIITENIPGGDDPVELRIGKIRVSDPDVIVTIDRVVQPPPATYFKIERDTTDGEWYLFLLSNLDYESYNGLNPGYVILIKQGTDSTDLRIVVGDVNDEPVIIERLEPDIAESYPENVEPPPTGLSLTKAIATDKDSIDNQPGQIKFELQHMIGNAGDPTFRIDENTGEVFIMKKFDYSLFPMHRLNVIVYDSEKVHTDNIVITLDIKDLPNRPPEWTNFPSIISIDENLPVEAKIVNVVARDGDLGVNWPIEYTLEQDLAGDPYFKIDENSGEITIAREIDAEKLYELTDGLSITLTVTATEKAPIGEENPDGSIAGSIIVNIRDLNDNPPEICTTANPLPDDECQNAVTFTSTISEDAFGIIDLDSVFVVRDKDSTLQFAKYTAAFGPDTPQQIRNAFVLQPNRESSMITEYSISIQSTNLLDYEGSDGFWHDEEGVAKPVEFSIIITASGSSEIAATATIILTVLDKNDNSPVFENLDISNQYVFAVCENQKDGTVLALVTEDPDQPEVCPPDQTVGAPLVIHATDLDISKNFGSESIRYRWSENSKKPPLEIDEMSGKMTINNEVNFDYERFKDEIYIVEAYDNPDNADDRRVTTAPVRFKILDKNDMPVDLRLASSRVTIQESVEPSGPYFDGITADDVDLSANIVFEMTIDTTFVKDSNHSSGYREINLNADDIQEWFKIEQYQDPVVGKRQRARIMKKGTSLPDREGGGVRDIDRVDLTITAKDLNTEEGTNLVSQPFTFLIEDINDERPVWEDIEVGVPVEVTVIETEEFETGQDPSTDIQREIYVFRARDPDRVSQFNFNIEPKDCEEFCDDMLNLVELVPDPNPSVGRAVLRRRLNELIDREEQKFYGSDTDILKYTVSVNDGIADHVTSTDIIIAVEDINDNVPEWDDRDKYENPSVPFTVKEDETDPDHVILRFQATDKDKQGSGPDGRYGKVNYQILDTDVTNNGYNDFLVDLETGELRAKPGQYNWTFIPQYAVTVEALDYYRPGSQSGSNKIQVTVIITVIDSNTNSPQFVTRSEETLITIEETAPQVGIPFEETVLVKDVDDPSTGNAQLTAEITQVLKDGVQMDVLPFEVGDLLEGPDANHKNIQIVPTTTFQDQYGIYDVTFRVKDQGTPELLPSDKTYQIEITDVNQHAPEFVYPITGITILVSLESPIGRLQDFFGEDVPPASATDKDDPETPNGRPRYRIIPNGEEDDGSNYFDIPNEGNGYIYLSTPFDDTNARHYTLTIEAFDEGLPTPMSSTAVARIVVVPDTNREPTFLETTPYNISMKENLAQLEVGVREAYDPDEELGEEFPEEDLGVLWEIYYHLVGGNGESFEVFVDETTKMPLIRTKVPLDREEIPYHQVVVFVSNSATPPIGITPPDQIPIGDARFLLINVEVEDEYDTSPEFVRTGVISGGISTNNNQDDVVTQITVTDLDLNEEISFTISSPIVPSDSSLPNEQAPFRLSPVSDATNPTAALILTFTPQAQMEGYYTFSITALDKGDQSVTAQVKIYIIKDNNVIDFKFENRRDDIISKQDILANILTESFTYQCNIDRINEDATDIDFTIVKAHFVDLTKNEPILAVYISEQQFEPEVYSKLVTDLESVDIYLATDGIGGPTTTPENGDRIMTYLLIAGVVILAVVLLVISATCYFNNRSLSRRVRALTATTFGSQISGLNRTGATTELPNTNEFALEGSNPIWTTNPDEKKMPAFDTESIGSGGSVLIGVEDDDDFKNYKSTNNPLFGSNMGNNEGQGDLNEDDYMDDLYDNSGNNNHNNNNNNMSNPRQNTAYESDGEGDSYEDPHPYSDDDGGENNFTFGGEGGHVDDDDGGDSNFTFGGAMGSPNSTGINNDTNAHENYDMEDDDEDYSDIPLPPTTRRNPLMNLGYEDDVTTHDMY